MCCHAVLCLQAERREGKAREARHKLTVERLRRQNIELQVGAWHGAAMHLLILPNHIWHML